MYELELMISEDKKIAFCCKIFIVCVLKKGQVQEFVFQNLLTMNVKKYSQTQIQSRAG